MYSSISLVMHGIKKCSGSCLYCSAASTMKYNEDGNKNTFKFDREKTKKKILEYTNIDDCLKKGDKCTLHIDVWGGNPLENFDEFKQVIDFCENELKEFSQISIHTSGNGLELRDNEKVQFLIDHNIHYQLSHDGCGQFLRTGTIDPIYWDKTKDNIVKLARLGILDWINTTLNGRNYSFFENMDFWNKWRRENNLMECTAKTLTIKLNHIYEGTEYIHKKWMFKGYKSVYNHVVVPKEGEEVGDLNFKGEALSTFMHELRMMGLISMMPNIKDSYEWAPYINYILGQTQFDCVEGETNSGACRQFQMGLSNKNFAIDTIGEYCQCNLIDSSVKVKDPECTRLPECETCEYKNFSGCKPCGSEKMTICRYYKEHARVCQEFEQIRMLLNELQKNKLSNCECNCNKESNAIYCVSNYKI